MEEWSEEGGREDGGGERMEEFEVRSVEVEAISAAEIGLPPSSISAAAEQAPALCTLLPSRLAHSPAPLLPTCRMGRGGLPLLLRQQRRGYSRDVGRAGGGAAATRPPSIGGGSTDTQGTEILGLRCGYAKL